MEEQKRIYDEAFRLCETVRGKLNGLDYQTGFLKHLYLYSVGKISKIELEKMAVDAIKQFPVLVDMFNELLEHCESIGGFLSLKELENSRSQVEEEPDKKRRKKGDQANPIQEIDVWEYELFTPSYRLLPQEYRVDRASQRSGIVHQVLNNRMVCKPSGYGSFKHGDKNKYEKILFRCEDDQCEVDVLLNSLKSAEQQVEKLRNNFKENKISLEAPFKVEDYLSVLNIRCIQKMYEEEDHDDDEVVNKLKEDPLVALPIISNRLKQKVGEIAELKSGREKIWAQVYAENHYEALANLEY